jgi:hypothetical protein
LSEFYFCVVAIGDCGSHGGNLIIGWKDIRFRRIETELSFGLLQSAFCAITSKLKFTVVQPNENFPGLNFLSKIDIRKYHCAGNFSRHLYEVDRRKVAGQFDLTLNGDTLNACRTNFDSGRTATSAPALTVLTALSGLTGSL